MKIHLAGSESRNFVHDGHDPQSLLVLCSFFYMDDWCLEHLSKWDLLLDSGAFTFLERSKSGTDWDSYIDKYCEFINSYDIKKFFELDIDPIVGLDKVSKIRERIENKTEKQTIPVWHISRGLDNFKAMCRDYNYVSLGGIVSGEWKGRPADCFRPFIDIAHENDAQIHGLGYTNLKGLLINKFDSVDSTAWTSGNRFGGVYVFKNGRLSKINRKPNQRMINPKKLAVHNFGEWVKFQRYAQEYY